MKILSKPLIFLLLGFIAIAMLASCGGRDGNINTLEKPYVAITSYEGDSNADSLLTQADIVQYFQQTIYWDAYSNGASIDGVAFRVGKIYQNTDGSFRTEYVASPGFDVIMPDTNADDDQRGWIYHYNEGADESIPLEITPQKSIWTKATYAVVNFPANSVQESDTTDVVLPEYDSEYVGSVFELKVRDSNGLESAIAQRYFKVKTCMHQVNISTTKGALDEPDNNPADYSRTGKGFTLSFTMTGDVPFIDREPWYYRYRIKRVEFVGNSVNSAVYVDSTAWYDTYGQEDVAKVTLYANDETIQGVPEEQKLLWNESYNQVEVTVVDYSGFESPADTRTFYVSGRYKPSALIYTRWIPGLGDYHWSQRQDESIEEQFPNTVGEDGSSHIGTQFFYDSDQHLTAIYSSNLRFYLKWGYYGEYEDNKPDNKKKANVLDPRFNDYNYKSAITYFDLRLNGDYLYYAPYIEDAALFEQYVITDPETGKRWLRVPADGEIAQKTVLSSGMMRHGAKSDYYSKNVFEVRVIDLQGVASDPEMLEFYIIDPTAIADKHGVLIVDDTPDNTTYTPADKVNGFYEEMLADYDHDYLDYAVISTADVNLHNSTCYLAPSELMQYKAVLYHTDNMVNPSLSFSDREEESMMLAMRTGTSVIVSAAHQLSDLHDAAYKKPSPLMGYFGISPYQEDVVQYITKTANNVHNPYVVGMNSEIAGLDHSASVIVDATAYNSLIEQGEGVGTIAYFNQEDLLPNTVAIGGIIPKAASDAPMHPGESTYYHLLDKPVLIRHDNGTYNCYMSGVPFSIFNPAEFKPFIDYMLADVGVEQHPVAGE